MPRTRQSGWKEGGGQPALENHLFARWKELEKWGGEKHGISVLSSGQLGARAPDSSHWAASWTPRRLARARLWLSESSYAKPKSAPVSMQGRHEYQSSRTSYWLSPTASHDCDGRDSRMRWNGLAKHFCAEAGCLKVTGTTKKLEELERKQ